MAPLQGLTAEHTTANGMAFHAALEGLISGKADLRFRF